MMATCLRQAGTVHLSFIPQHDAVRLRTVIRKPEPLQAFLTTKRRQTYGSAQRIAGDCRQRRRGVVTAGSLLLKPPLKRVVFLMGRSAGPQIRGGRRPPCYVSPRNRWFHDDHYHLLVAIDWENINRFAAEIPLNADSLILATPRWARPQQPCYANPARHRCPCRKLPRAWKGRANMVALGAVCQASSVCQPRPCTP